MRRLIVSLWFGLWPMFLGVFLPYFRFSGSLKLLNIFWSVIYGLGLWGIDKTVGLRIGSPLVAVGVLVWPIVVSTAMFLVGWKLDQMSPRMRLVIELALLASSFVAINLNQALQPPMSKLATFYRLFYAVW